MKQIFLGLLFSAVSLASWADGQYLKVWQTDGTVIAINLNDEPSTSYSDGNLVINTQETSVMIPLEKMRKYTYVTDTDDIKSVNVQNVRFTDNGNVILISGLDSNASINLLTVDGKVLHSEQSNGRSEVSVNVASLPAGVYAVKINDITHKLLKR